MKAQQCVKLTGTNHSIELDRSHCRCPNTTTAPAVVTTKKTRDGSRRCLWHRAGRALVTIAARSHGVAQRSLPAWWLLRSDKTRSHPELGRQTLKRPWYYVSRRGRVGRRQARQERPLTQYDVTNPAAGWSSPVARQAHNLKAAGSNPAPATTNAKHPRRKTGVFAFRGQGMKGEGRASWRPRR